MRRILRALLLLAIPAMATAADPAFVLRAGDRVVFLGDSITEGNNYTRPVAAYLSLRYPDMKLTFFNAGWSGDNAAGSLHRLDRDVLALEPTVVTICLGMNDGYYMKYGPWIGDGFMENMRRIVEKLKVAGVRVVLLTPGIVDEDCEKGKWMKEVRYNDDGLAALARLVLEYASKESIPVYDIHSLMNEVLGRARSAEKDFPMVPDGIHPDEAGGMVMAYGLLKALGVPGRDDAVTVDLGAGRVNASGEVTAGPLSKSPEGCWTFRLGMKSLPYPVPARKRRVLPYLPFQRDFNGVRLAVRGLDGPGCVEIGAQPTTYMGATVLAEGVALQNAWGTDPLEAAGEVEPRIAAQEEIYFTYWRKLSLKHDYNQYGENKPELHREGIAASLKLQEGLWDLARPPRDGFTVRIWPLPTAPETLGNEGAVRCVALSPGIDGGEGAPSATPLEVSAKRPADLKAPPGFWTARRLNTGDPGNNIGDLIIRAGKGAETVAYAAIVLDNPASQSGWLEKGEGDLYEGWLDGSPLPAASGNRVALKLAKGRHLLLVRVKQARWTMGLSLRFRGLKRPLSCWPVHLAPKR